jgi:hypothetical protein
MRSSNLNRKGRQSFIFQASPNMNSRLNTIKSQAVISIHQVFIRSGNAKDAKDVNSKFLESARMAAE